MSKPLLSICIPTFNRAHLLKDLLNNISNETKGIGDLIELVICDNCSEDHTEELVTSFNGRLNMKYQRNERNIGIAANIIDCPSYATGEFCWIIGDDDLFVRGAINDIIEIIKKRPNESCIITGYSYEDTSKKDYILSSQDEIEFSSPIFLDTTLEMSLNKWEDSFLYSKVAALHTSIVSCVFRREPWEIELLKTKNWQLSNSLTSLESTFPHTVIWANMFVGKPVYFVSKPMVYFFVGEQEWLSEKWGTMMFSFCLQLAQEFRRLGGEKSCILYYENLILQNSDILVVLILNRSLYSDSHYSLSWLLREYGDYEILRKSIYDIIFSPTVTLNERSKVALVIIFRLMLIPRKWNFLFKLLSRIRHKIGEELVVAAKRLKSIVIRKTKSIFFN
jgi:glycosyltransferase involved in cell wall biosynthesis